MRKKQLCGILKFMFILFIGFIINSIRVYAVDDSGTDGEIKWEISGDTLTLSAVEGTQGRMKDYSYNEESPWQNNNYCDNVKKIVVDSSVTKLGTFAFSGDYKVNTFEIHGNIKEIPGEFARNLKIEELVIYEGVEKIEDGAFMHSKVKSAKIPQSVTSIDIMSFGQVADGVCNFLQKVYGYAGSVSEMYVNDFNEKIKASREADETKDYESLDGYFGVDYDEDGSYDKEGYIEFVSLDGGSVSDTETPSYELQINQNYTDSSLGNYDVGGNASDIIYESDNDELKKILAHFTAKYPAEKLIPLDITFSENGVTISKKECTIKIPVPTAWNSHKEYIKVLTVTNGQIEVVASTIIHEGSTYYISFMPPHFSPYALYLDYDAGNDSSSDNSDDDIENVTTGKELDDTPKTGATFNPLIIVIICLLLAGVGIILYPRSNRRRLFK